MIGENNMSNKVKFEQISNADANGARISKLADRPNEQSYYGTGNLTAAELKARFDALPELNLEKINALIAAINSGEILKSISVDKADQDNLYDFLALFRENKTGKYKSIADYIKIYYERISDAQDGSYSISEAIKDIYNNLLRTMTDFSTLDEIVTETKATIDEAADKVNRYESRLLNIESYLAGENFVTDEAEAYQRTVPERACEVAKVMKIGGIIQSAKLDEGNLFPYPYKDYGYIIDNRGAVTIRSDIDEGDSWILVTDYVELPGGTYILDVGENIDSSHNLAPYEIDGKDVGWELISPHQIRIIAYKKWSFSGVYIELAGYESVTLYPVLYLEDSPVTWQPRGGLNQPTKVTAISSENKDHGILDRFRIPDEVVAMNEYGVGVESLTGNFVYNSVEYTDNGVRLHKRLCALVLDGTEAWATEENKGEIKYCYLTDIPVPRVRTIREDKEEVDYTMGMCSHFDFRESNYYDYDSDEYFCIAGELRAVVNASYGVMGRDSLTEYLAAQYAAGTPVTVWYELDGYEEIDLTDLMPRSNLLKVSSGNKVTAENEFENPVPFSMKYLFKYTKEAT